MSDNLIENFVASLDLSTLAGKIEYQSTSIVSQTLLTDVAGTVTLFAFDRGQGLSEHTAPYDAIVHVLEGEAEISIDGAPMTVSAGQQIVMPANHPHALQADLKFKMLLVMVKI
ncbi:MAG: cupin domain-containing protein [Candidatus Marinimicrobia bacterium]|nr:cupin domain-containing protein [Candidatus Neomarinimicrobiota bacterium]